MLPTAIKISRKTLMWWENLILIFSCKYPFNHVFKPVSFHSSQPHDDMRHSVNLINTAAISTIINNSIAGLENPRKTSYYRVSHHYQELKEGKYRGSDTHITLSHW